MLRIRLRRTGKKKQPSYRIVVADSRAPRDGDFVETLGTYHPLSDPSVIVLDAERAKHWLDHGAQPSDRVWKILAIQGLAEIPAKLQTRIELGKQRAEEAKKLKPKEEAAPAAEAPVATSATAPAPAAEVPAADGPAPAAEAPAATEADASAAEETEAPAAEADAPAAEEAEAPAAEATEPAAETEALAESGEPSQE